MRSLVHRIFLLISLLGLSKAGLAQLPAAPALATSNVTEAAQYGVMYELNIQTSPNYSTLASIIYAVNNSSLALTYNRIAYFMQLDSKWVWVSMNKFNTTNAQLGVPYTNSGIIFQQTVTAMNVYGSSGSGVTNATGINGNIEIWPDCYDVPAGLAGIGGNSASYDFNDTRNNASNCYGSFQVHNYAAAQTIFAFNCFMGGPVDLGIGNNSGNSNPDWTFMHNASGYTTKKLYILVQNGISVQTQPSTSSRTACINGTVPALTVSTSISTGTITNYQWYGVSTATNTGGTLLATNTTSATSNSFTPPTSSAGNQYYYCVINGSGGFVATSSVSGQHTVVNPTLSVSGASAICAGNSISLSTSSAFSFTSYAWSSGGTASSILVSPSSNTSYSVTGTTSLGCVAASAPVTVTVNSLPTITASSGSICSGSSFVFTPSGAVTYTYSSGTATVNPTTSTNYTISGSSAQGCVGSATDISVQVYNLPVVAISGTTALCIGSSASFTASGASTYTWSNGSNATSISVSPTTTTVYSLLGTSTEGCVSAAAASNSVTVYTLPVLSIVGDNTVCAGSSVQLNATGAQLYSWNTGGTGTSVVVSPTTTSLYSVAGMDANGCVSSSSAVTTVSVINLPNVSISGTSAICAGQSATLTASGANTYTWSTGSNALTIAISPSATASYTLQGATVEGCVSATAAVASITVNDLPVLSISGTSTLCAGGSVALTASGANSYSWSTNSNAATLSVNPTSNSSYSVTGTSTAGCVSAAPAIQAVTVYSLPVINIAGASTLCAGSSIVLTASGANSYSWSTGANTPTIAVSTSSTTGYAVSGSSTDGCVSSSSAVTTVSVINLPNISISGTAAICAGQTATLTAGGANTYTWSTGSNALTIAISPSATASYTLQGATAEGCVSASVAIASVTVNALPVLNITGTSTLCAGGSVALTASGANTYSWSTNSSAVTISVNPTSTSSYSVSGTSTAGCVSAAPAVQAVTVYSLPVITIAGASTLCAGSSIILTANGANSYSWSTGANTPSITVNTSTATSYAVLGKSADGCVSTSSAISNVSVYALPVVTISGTSTLCAGNAITLTANGAATYTWNTAATNATLSIAPSSNTVITVSGTSSLGCLSATSASQAITVFAIPSLSISSAQASVCAGQSMVLTASGAATYSWTGNGSSSAITVTPGSTTSYSLNGLSSQGCSAVQVAKTISVIALPAVSVSGTTSICRGATTTLTAAGASTYSWSGLGTTAATPVSPTTTAIYTVTGTSSLGCSQSTTYTLVVNQLPNVQIAGTSGVCTGQDATLTVSGAGTYSWSTGATTATIITSPATSTVYTVVGTDALGCAKTASQAVTVAANLLVSINGPTTICAGDNFSLTAGGASTYTWNTTETTQVIAPSPTTTTTYSVIGSTGGCSNTAVATISVNATPSLVISGATVACLGDSVTLSVTGADTYTWSNNSNATTIVVAPNTSTVYMAVGTYTNGCSNSSQHSISLYNLPNVTVSGNTVICFGDTTLLTANGASSYTWNTGANSASISLVPASSNTYFVVGTDVNGCKDSSAVVMLTVNPVPSLNVAATASAVCIGESVTYTVSGALVYLWNNNSTSNVMSYTPTATTSYTVSGTNTFACTSSTVINLTVNPLPTLSINSPSTICLHESTKLIVSGAGTYTWNTGFVGDTLVVSPNTATSYTVNAFSNAGCSGSKTVEIKVSACNTISELSSDSDIRLYPNPSSTNVTLEISNAFNSEIIMRNVLGQMVWQQKAESTNVVPLQQFDKGVYYISIYTQSNKVKTLRLIKE